MKNRILLIFFLFYIFNNFLLFGKVQFINDKNTFKNEISGFYVEEINFDNIEPNTIINNSIIKNVVFKKLNKGCSQDGYYDCGYLKSADLIVIKSSSLLPSTSGDKLLSPGGNKLDASFNPDIENDDLLMEFIKPVKAVGFDIVFKLLDGASYVGLKVFDKNGKLLYENKAIEIPSTWKSGSQFVGFISDKYDIKKIEIDDYDSSPPDEEVGYDSIIYVKEKNNCYTEEDLKKAREEGYKQGYKEGLEKGKSQCSYPTPPHPNNCEATFDFFDNTFHVPCFKGKKSYWLDFKLINDNPVQLELKNFGENK